MKRFYFLKNILCSLAVAGVVFIFAWWAGLRLYVVLSGSMSPAIPTGSVVLVRTKGNDIKEGDVITYQIDKTSVTHRVIEITDDGYITKGDANDEADPNLVSADTVTGKVVIHMPVVGYGLVWTQQHMLVMLLLLSTIVFGIVFPEKTDMKKTKRNEMKGEIKL